MPIVAAIPYIIHYGVPFVFGFGIRHIYCWVKHRKFDGQSLGDIAKS